MGSALDILECVAARPASLTVRDVMVKLGIPQASAFRLVNTLAERGYLRKNGNGLLEPGPRGAFLAQTALSANQFRNAAEPFARRLLEKTGKTVELTVVDNDEITFIDVLESPEPVKYTRRIGSPLIGSTNPITLSILAHVDERRRKTILARMRIIREYYLKANPAAESVPFALSWDRKELEHIARQGYAADFGEQTAGVSRISSPVFDARGQIAGTIGIAGPTFSISAKQAHKVTGEIVQTAAALSRELGAGQGKDGRQ